MRSFTVKENVCEYELIDNHVFEFYKSARVNERDKVMKWKHSVTDVLLIWPNDKKWTIWRRKYSYSNERKNFSKSKSNQLKSRMVRERERERFPRVELCPLEYGRGQTRHWRLFLRARTSGRTIDDENGTGWAERQNSRWNHWFDQNIEQSNLIEKGRTGSHAQRSETSSSQNCRKQAILPFRSWHFALSFQDLKSEYEAKKSRYDALNANFESSRASLESVSDDVLLLQNSLSLWSIQDVRGFYEEQYAQETRFHTLKAHMLLNAVQLKRANDETNAYISKDKAAKSYRYDWPEICGSISLSLFREQLNKQINESEARTKNSREKQRTTKDVHIDGTKQMKYWRDLLRMMELKRKLATVGLLWESWQVFHSAFLLGWSLIDWSCLAMCPSLSPLM